MPRQNFQEQMIGLQEMQLKAFDRRVFYVFYGISQSSFQITFSYKDDFDSNVLYTKMYCFLQIYVRQIATKNSYLCAVS